MMIDDWSWIFPFTGFGKASDLAGGKVVGGVQVNETFLCIVQGSITDHNADIIVNSTDDSFSMGGKWSMNCWYNKPYVKPRLQNP